ncbi:diacylglycerol kinase family lipid kinase [Rhodococcus sp. BP-349]|uniref:diacylglycerol/lipid kinase family protein n=1 Tax=unclassified Rhodococcus (in: high G+C Gram-positive bacteria) TaxID=192944 RepID=UPI001C9A5CB2|nr:MULTISPECIES: diacylglycerol kinase family protein [unclassified Rhodococcus (in: high G+C Gram-positive bacteria)]MBY6538945.1 diacylglycerol kinase family lipid kinase [Rhodococcus sp. BP-363]MBY6543282.1 diacylglycerol kinase family lipid kinase [Rhodococcus sp. BP-369]MBY6562512.1 diacylglycerol kinase family lipid kinase [Rhodococcus sp. BP-370]MBY6576804.1 diacylglycerol kinase family lipid kinase [Rhodococcus sp. BP-364]MBY6586105.1 diacylglycerol kinase family lipid kinase [Rhodococ
MRAILIVNPNATSTTAAGRDLVAHALASRVSLSVLHTTHRGHASELATEARRAGIDLVIVHGGDGTVNEVVNGLLGVPAPTSMQSVTVGPVPLLAVVPGGSANVFARSLGIAKDPVEATNQLIDLLESGSSRRIGLGHCDRTWFLFNAGLGWDADVCDAIDRGRKGGEAVTPSRYVRTAITTFFRRKRRDPHLTVETDTGEAVAGVHFAFVTNSDPWTFLDARPVRTNPGTSFDGGLGIFAMRSTKVFTTLRVVVQMLSGTSGPHSRALLRDDDVKWIRVRSAEPTGLQVDGDYLGERTEVEFASAPDALAVVAPLPGDTP